MWLCSCPLPYIEEMRAAVSQPCLLSALILTELALAFLLLLKSSFSLSSLSSLLGTAKGNISHTPRPLFLPSFQFWGEFLPSNFSKIFMWSGKISCLSVTHFVIEILEVAMVRVINISIINLFHKRLKLSSASVKQTKSEVWGGNVS